MLMEFLGVTLFVALLFSAWLVLLAVTRRVVREDANADPLHVLSQGCGTCEKEGLCAGRGGQGRSTTGRTMCD